MISSYISYVIYYICKSPYIINRQLLIIIKIQQSNNVLLSPLVSPNPGSATDIYISKF